MKDIKRFLSPISLKSVIFWKSVIGYSSRQAYALLGVIFLGLITHYIELQSLGPLQNVLYIYLGLILSGQLFIGFTHHRSWTTISGDIKKRIARKYIPQYIAMRISYTQKIGTGKTLSIIEKGIESWGYGISYTIVSITSLVLTFFYVAYSVSLLGHNYLIGFICILLLGGLVAYHLNKKMRLHRKDRVEAKHNASRALIKIIMSKIEVMQKGSAEKEISKLNNHREEEIQANIGMSPYTHRFFWGPTMLIDISKIVLFGIMGSAAISDGTSISSIVNLGGGLILLDQTLNELLQYYKNITKEFDNITRMRKYFDNSPEENNYTNGIAFSPQTSSIKIQEAVFSYTPSNPILSDLSLTIPGGSKTALVGPSGGGKSTIIKLIAGYLRPDSGSVVVDDQDLAEVSLKSYYKHIGYLTQEPSVFDGTVWDNLTYAMDTSTDGDDAIMEKVKEAITDAQCEFIWDLPDGLQTEIGERGVRLSGGQRQRLAIAKIFLKDPEIVLLDEPTSALDSQSEEAVTVAMNRLFEGRTVIVIAHRLQTVKHADRILYIEDGKVVEEGSHTELMKQKGKYYTMVELQSGF